MRAVVLLLVLACACDKGNRAEPVSTKPCVPGGCNGEICVEEGDSAATACWMRDEFACYGTARCERQRDGTCGYTETPELEVCIAMKRAMEPPPVAYPPSPPPPPPDEPTEKGD
jgi:hypothetical protein